MINIRQNMKIAFLDFDGVLIPKTFSEFLRHMENLSFGDSSSKDQFGEYFYPPCVHNLVALHKEKDISIVFSTNWRNEIEHSEFIELFQKRIDIPIVGFTPEIDPKIGKRGNEIDCFLSNFKHKVDKYVIIDDMGEKNFLPNQFNHLVICNEMFGFTKSNLKKALEILS
jgi:hypothetical protein